MNDISESGMDADAEFGRRLRDAAALLEAIVADRGLLARVPAEDRRRVLAAAGNVYNPDVNARRRHGEGHHTRAEGGANPARRFGARGHRDSVTAAQAGVHHAERAAAERVRHGRHRGRAPAGRRRAELLRLQAGLHRDPSFLRSAVPGVRRTEFQRSAPSSRTCAAASRC